MEQRKHKERICREAERLPQHDINRDSDDKQNSIVFQEMMDTDWCIWRVEEAGLSRNSANYPGTLRVNDRHKNSRNDMQVSFRESHE